MIDNKVCQVCGTPYNIIELKLSSDKVFGFLCIQHLIDYELIIQQACDAHRNYLLNIFKAFVSPSKGGTNEVEKLSDREREQK